jgi:hypothetical protein
MVGKEILLRFQWRWSHIQIPSELTGITETSGHPESVRVLRHRLLGRWPVYRVGAHGGTS